MVNHNKDSRSNNPVGENIKYYLKLVGLFTIPFILISIATGKIITALPIIPTLVIFLLIEAFQSHRNLLWSAIILVVPTVFCIPYAISTRLDPTVPQFALVMLGIGAPIIGLVGYAILVGCYRLLKQDYSSTLQWSILVLTALIIGITLPALHFIHSQLQQDAVDEVQKSFRAETEHTLQEQWSILLNTNDIATTDSSVLIRARDSILTVDKSGRTKVVAQLSKNTFPFTDVAQLDSDRNPEIVTHHEAFQQSIDAFDHNGNHLWNYTVPESKSSLGAVAIANLTENNTDEILVGSLTGAGLQLLDARGNQMWQRDTTAPVTDVAAVSETDSSRGLALARTSEAIEIYDRNGNHLRSITPDSSNGNIQLTPTNTNSPPTLICCSDGPKISALTLSGEKIWSRNLPASKVVLASSNSYLAALDTDGQQIYLFDIDTGQPLAVSDVKRGYNHIAWIDTRQEESPLLLAATSNKLYGLTLGITGKLE